MPDTDTQDEFGIARGTVFDTYNETHCIALDRPDQFGNFDGIDPYGTITTYNVIMVDMVRASQYPLFTV